MIGVAVPVRTIEADREPVADGVKITEIWQLAPGTSEPPQLSLSEKSPELVPAMEMEKATGTVPMFVAVSINGALGTLIGPAGKDNVGRLNVIAGTTFTCIGTVIVWLRIGAEIHTIAEAKTAKRLARNHFIGASRKSSALSNGQPCPKLPHHLMQKYGTRHLTAAESCSASQRRDDYGCVAAMVMFSMLMLSGNPGPLGFSTSE